MKKSYANNCCCNNSHPCGSDGGCGPRTPLTVRTGDPGKSAYQLALEHGYQGTVEQWLDSLRASGGNTPTIKRIQTTTLEAGIDGSLVSNFVLADNPAAQPVITLGIVQDSGGKSNSLYWSGDNGVTARIPLPKAGDKLYVNPSILLPSVQSPTLPAGLLLTIQYSTAN